MTAKHRIFYHNQTVLSDVEEFLTELTPEHVIAINTIDSASRFLAAIIVWYWSTE